MPCKFVDLRRCYSELTVAIFRIFGITSPWTLQWFFKW